VRGVAQLRRLGAVRLGAPAPRCDHGDDDPHDDDDDHDRHDEDDGFCGGHELPPSAAPGDATVSIGITRFHGTDH